MNGKAREFRCVEDIAHSDYELIFQNADILRKCQNSSIDCADLLKGKIVTCIFSEVSTRTKAMLQLAVARLGGILCFENLSDQSYYSKGEESLNDAIFSYSQFSDIPIIRDEDIDLASLNQNLETPIINALAGPNEHSLAAIGRAYSLQRRFGSLSDITIGIYGSIQISRPLKSLVKLLSLFNTKAYNDPIIDELALVGDDKSNVEIIVSEKSINEFISKIDALFVVEGVPHKICGEEIISRYCEEFRSIDLNLLNNLKKNALFSVGMPYLLPNGKKTISDGVEVKFIEEKKKIYKDWVFCTQALICYLLEISVEEKINLEN